MQSFLNQHSRIVFICKHTRAAGAATKRIATGGENMSLEDDDGIA